MNKYLKIVIIAAIVIGVFVLAFLVTGKEKIRVIDMDEYNEISSGSGFIYYGDKDSKEALNDVFKDYGVEVGILESTDKVEGLKENTFYEYKDGKVVYKYSGDLTSYKFERSLQSEGIIGRTYLTISLSEYKEIIKSKGYNFMFIGSETCSYCTQFKEAIKEALKTNDFTIYYIDISSLTEDEYNELIATDDYMTKNEWGTPLNLLYKDGKRIAELNGYVPADELISFLKENKVI